MNVSHRPLLFLAIGLGVGSVVTGAALQLRKPVDHYAEGLELMQKSRFGQAADAFERTLRANPENPAALVSLAAALQSDKRNDEALKAYQRADEATSKMMVQFYGNLAALHSQRDDAKAAQESYRKLAAFQPQSVDSSYNLGMAEASKGRFADAIRHLEDVLRMDPRHAGAAFQAARVSEQAGDKRAALGWYQHALRIDPTLKAAKDRVAALQGGKAAQPSRGIASTKPAPATKRAAPSKKSRSK